MVPVVCEFVQRWDGCARKPLDDKVSNKPSWWAPVLLEKLCLVILHMSAGKVSSKAFER